MSTPTCLPSYQKYISDFDSFVKTDEKSSWLKKLRQEGLNHFRELKFPVATKSNEEWQHTNVSNIARTVFEYQSNTEIGSISTSKIKTISPWNETWIQLIFINGVLSNKLSSLNNNSLLKERDRMTNIIQRYLFFRIIYL